MNPPVIPLEWVEVALLLVMMVAVVALSGWLRLGLGRSFALGAARSVVQLSTVGFVIGWVFRQQTGFMVLGLLTMMCLVAGYTAARRSGERITGLTAVMTGVVALVSIVAVTYLALAVLGLREWNARYLIPLGGMLIGNAMNAATLAVERLGAELRGNAVDVETWLMLGASPRQAAGDARKTAIRAAVSPTLNTMMTVGIVTLPGMMTGQLLGGSPPFQAAMYQLLILFGISFCALTAAVLAVYAVAPRFFTPAWQLKRDLPVPKK